MYPPSRSTWLRVAAKSMGALLRAAANTAASSTAVELGQAANRVICALFSWRRWMIRRTISFNGIMLALPKRSCCDEVVLAMNLTPPAPDVKQKRTFDKYLSANYILEYQESGNRSLHFAHSLLSVVCGLLNIKLFP